MKSWGPPPQRQGMRRCGPSAGGTSSSQGRGAGGAHHNEEEEEQPEARALGVVVTLKSVMAVPVMPESL